LIEPAAPVPAPDRLALARPRAEVTAELQKRIDLGKELQARPIPSQSGPLRGRRAFGWVSIFQLGEKMPPHIPPKSLYFNALSTYSTFSAGELNQYTHITIHTMWLLSLHIYPRYRWH